MIAFETKKIDALRLGQMQSSARMEQLEKEWE
jgi:hypothetical protein